MSNSRTLILTWLRANTALIALVGDRIYSQKRPQNSLLPCIVYTILDTNSIKCLDGPTEMEKITWRMDVKAKDVTALDAIRIAVESIEALHTINVNWVWREGSSESYDPPYEMDEVGTLSMSVELTSWTNQRS